jgi:hypothetical protein
LDGIVEGESVHGDFVRFHGNSIALSGISSLPARSILVKEDFGKKAGPAKSITAMERIPGFNKDSGDWFFVKFSTSGKASSINGSSCAKCHRKADGGDFFFAND